MADTETGVRINKYLAQQKIASRREADVLVERRQRLLDGAATRIPWNEAKAQLQRLAE